MRRGFALLGVLWTVGLLSAVAAVLLRGVHADLRQTQVDLALARAQAAADGEVRLAILQALAQSPSAWDGVSRNGVSLQDESKLVDLNHASETDLAALLKKAGVADDRAVPLAKAVIAGRSYYSTLDLTKVAGIDSALTHRLAALTTVHSSQPSLRIAVQASVDGVTAVRVADVLLAQQGANRYRILTWTTELPG